MSTEKDSAISTMIRRGKRHHNMLTYFDYWYNFYNTELKSRQSLIFISSENSQ